MLGTKLWGGAPIVLVGSNQQLLESGCKKCKFCLCSKGSSDPDLPKHELENAAESNEANKHKVAVAPRSW